MEKALRDIDMNMGRMVLEERAAQAGRISQRLRDERRRLVYAPAFQKIGADLATLSLQPKDTRAPLLRDLRRMAALMEELSAMESAFSVGNARPAPVDPVRQAEIIEEVRQVQKRILAWRQGPPSKPQD
jgi:hypothetical protein